LGYQPPAWNFLEQVRVYLFFHKSQYFLDNYNNLICYKKVMIIKLVNLLRNITFRKNGHETGRAAETAEAQGGRNSRQGRLKSEKGGRTDPA
jgi:hypothetical protein